MTGGVHGLRPLNDREFGLPRPRMGMCPSMGDPRFARMTEEAATLPRPLVGVCASVGDSTGFAL